MGGKHDTSGCDSQAADGATYRRAPQSGPPFTPVVGCRHRYVQWLFGDHEPDRHAGRSPQTMTVFGLHLDQAQWIVTAYVIVGAILVSAVAWLGNRLGNCCSLSGLLHAGDSPVSRQYAAGIAPAETAYVSG